MSNLYFERYAYPSRFIEESVKLSTFISVVIPVFKEENIDHTLKSLIACEKTQFPVEVIFVVNHPENATQDVKELSKRTVVKIREFLNQNPTELTIQIIKAYDLPAKKAGVGLARKIGMDEAAYRFNSIHQDGVILCFDADSQCLPNYLKEIENHFFSKG